MSGALEYRLPTATERFLASRQQQGAVSVAFPRAAYGAFTLGSYGVLVVLAIRAWRQGDRRAAVFAVALLLAIAGSILLHAGLVGPYSRYHAKVGWLGWFAVVALAARARGAVRI